jgi:hypothetical protein
MRSSRGYAFTGRRRHSIRLGPNAAVLTQTRPPLGRRQPPRVLRRVSDRRRRGPRHIARFYDGRRDRPATPSSGSRPRLQRPGDADLDAAQPPRMAEPRRQQIQPDQSKGSDVPDRPEFADDRSSHASQSAGSSQNPFPGVDTLSDKAPRFLRLAGGIRVEWGVARDARCQAAIPSNCGFLGRSPIRRSPVDATMVDN